MAPGVAPGFPFMPRNECGKPGCGRLNPEAAAAAALFPLKPNPLCPDAVSGGRL